MPDPSGFSNEREWMSACIREARSEGKPQNQAVAMCLNMWRRRKGSTHLLYLLDLLQCELKEIQLGLKEDPWEDCQHLQTVLTESDDQFKSNGVEDQPRAPAGTSEGGQWVSSGNVSSINVNRANKVSKTFEKTINNALSKVPQGVHEVLRDSGIEVHIGTTLPDISPDLAGEPPRGWPEGFTWDSVQGAFGDNMILISEQTVDRDGNAIKMSKGLTENTLWHEMGHGYNQALGSFSDSAEFVTAYEKDAAAIPAKDRGRLNYFLQEGEAGRDETFAQVFREIVGGGRSQLTKNSAFPSVAELVRDAIHGPGSAE